MTTHQARREMSGRKHQRRSEPTSSERRHSWPNLAKSCGGGAWVRTSDTGLMSSPQWSSLLFLEGRCWPLFGAFKRKIEVVEFPRPGTDHREQRVMAVEMAVMNQLGVLGSMGAIGLRKWAPRSPTSVVRRLRPATCHFLQTAPCGAAGPTDDTTSRSIGRR